MKKQVRKQLAVLLIMALSVCLPQALLAQEAKNGTAELLTLRTELASATTVKAKKDLLKQIGQTGTFVAMNVLANYLDDAQLAKTAAEGVYAIAMNHKEYNGTLTRSLLAKAAVKLGGAKRNAALARLAEAGTETGFVSMFNGHDLTGWKGLVENPIARSKMSAKELAEKQVEADVRMHDNWGVEDGQIVYNGAGYDNLCTVEQ